MSDEPTTTPIHEDDNKPATKGDIRRSQDELAQIVGKAIGKEVRTLRTGINTLRTDIKTDMQTLRTDMQTLSTNIKLEAEKTRDHFDAVAENIHLDVAGANKDEVELLTSQPQHLIIGPYEFRVFSNDP